MQEPNSIESHLSEERTFQPPGWIQADALIPSMEVYQKMYDASIADSDTFWGNIAEDFDWYQRWTTVNGSDLSKAHIAWFEGATTNLSHNCLDRHINAGHGDDLAITWEGDDGEVRTFTFAEVLTQVCLMANALRAHDVQRGDRVTIYMPMIPELAFALLACARIGAIHSVVFAGFSAESLAQRIIDGESDVIMTTDAGLRGGRRIELKSIADDAVTIAASAGIDVRRMFVNHRAGDGVGPDSHGWVEGRDIDLAASMAEQDAECEPEKMGSEDPLFILYTSGSTGKPKGLLHTHAGYMVFAATTCKYVFDLKPERDLHFCTADIGWITGHTYIVYGPLLNRVHTLMFEGTPTYPHPGRLWEVVEKHRPTTFYTAPTAIRALMVHGTEHIEKWDRGSLRVLGTVGEPINPEAWMWYHVHVGEERLPIVDTWWQTETGGIQITPLPAATTTKPGSATRPFFGIEPAVVRPDGSDCSPNEGGHLISRRAWPGMLRTIWGDHDRFVATYFSQHPGAYFTGDGARIDEDGDFWVMGRIDDVINVSGHRMGTAEVESALVEHEAVCEAAVVGYPHEIKGQGIYCFVTLEGGLDGDEGLRSELVQTVRTSIGPIATPDVIHFTPVLPKTRSGKIMRRILRKIAEGDVTDLGDTSTLADESVVEKLLAERT